MAHIVTLKDHNDEISYPITPVDAVFVDSNTTLSDGLADKADTDLTNVDAGAVTTAKIASGAVTDDKIDWTAFGAVDFAVGSESLVISRPYAFKILVIGSCSTWGYNGGTVTVQINSSPTLTPISSANGSGDQGNSVARSVVASGIFECDANTSYTFTSGRNSSGGQSGNNVIVGIITRIS